MVALDDDDEAVVGFAQVLGDGMVQGYLAQVAVVPTRRRRGIARALVEAASTLAGVQRLDLPTDDADQFYESVTHRTKRGHRLHPRVSATAGGD